MRVAPCPLAGVLLGGGYGAVLVDFGIDERNVAVVNLGLFVHQRKNASGARHCHDDGVDLLGDLVDVPRKLLGHGKKRDYDTDARRRLHGGAHFAEQQPDARVERPVDDKQASRNDVDHVKQVADVHNDGPEHIGISVGAVGVLEQLAVQVVKLLHGFRFVIEHLDHLLAVHGFLNVPFLGGKGLLLANEEFCRAAAQFAGYQKHDNDPGNDNEREPNAVPKHNEEDADNDGNATDKGRQRLPDELAERVDIVGIIAHNIAVLMRVKIADGQILHAVEHGFAHFGKKALRDIGGKLGFQCDGDQRKHVKPDQKQNLRDDDFTCLAPRHLLLKSGADRFGHLLQKDGRKRCRNGRK